MNNNDFEGFRWRVVGSFEKAIYAATDEYKSLDFVGSKEIRISAELGNQAAETDVDGRVSGVQKTRVSLVEEIDEEMKSRTSDIRNEDMIQIMNDNKMGDKNTDSEQWQSRVEKDVPNSAEEVFVESSPRESDHNYDSRNGGLGKGHVELGKSSVSQSDSTISMCQESSANGKCKAIGAGQSSSVGYGYEIGDMVWGKVKSHPWWPGHIYNEAFASPSVRRSRRSGHVLVAFFGDSSYGWFDPAELIPFDANFAEKSRQTSSRTFVKAVEEAVDEASRIRCLALACRCRNPYNFRPTEVEGYFAVDLSDYEPGAMYPMSQISKARESFRPKDTLAFIKQLALMPISDGRSSLDFIMNKTVALAYRKAVFEEFDETYAQAFGAQPVRPCREPMKAVVQPVRAPLSGPLVFAETLGKRKNSSKPNKAKDQANKDRYLFKRRDEPNELKFQQTGQTMSSMQPAYVVGSAELAAGDYMLQKRPPAVSAKHQIPAKLEQMARIGMDGGSLSSQDATGVKVESLADPTVMCASGLSEKETFHGGIDGVLLTSEQEDDATINLENDQPSASPLKFDEGFQQPPILPAIVEVVPGQKQVHIGGNGGRVLPTIDAKFHNQDSRIRIDKGAKKAKLLKHPAGELGAEKSVPVEKKKRKKELGSEMSSDRIPKRTATGKVGVSMGRVTEKTVQVGLPPREDFQIEHQRKDDGASSSLLPDSLKTQPMVVMGNMELKLPRLLGDLKALALDPFDSAERNDSEIVQRAFLKFRSVVYQKSLALSIPVEMGSDNPPHGNIKNLPSSKPPKPLVRPGDLTKGGLKRGPSDRQEELTAKRVKKINDLKSLTAEKKAVQKDGKETVALRHPKSLKPDLAKKTESPGKTPEPTMLVMKFPPETTLPSGSELKARLARFGPLDHSSTRIFWQSSTCRVVFIYRVDAETAHRHLSGNNTLFGNVNVRCHIRPLGAAVAPESESKVQREDALIETRDSSVEQRLPPAQQPSVQLKSCLKKPMGDEVGPTGGRGTPRVKFAVVEGESSGGGENLMVGNKNNFNNVSFGDGGTITSSHGIDFNSKNFQIQAQFPRNTHNFNTYISPAPTPALVPAPPVPRASNMDISQKMLSLLTKCNEVVTNIKSSLGYVPYYPL
ncbi:unnamed protein product [Camellia sinensis]